MSDPGTADPTQTPLPASLPASKNQATGISAVPAQAVSTPDQIPSAGVGAVSFNLATPQANPSPDSSKNLEKLGLAASGELMLADVPQVNQPNYTSCGEAAFTMAWNYQHPEQEIEVERVEAAGLKIGVYFPTSTSGPHGYMGTSPAGMQAIAGYYADFYHAPQPLFGNLEMDEGDAYAQLEARGLIFQELSAGFPVLIEVTDILGSPSSTINDSHYILVTGLDMHNGTVTFNDPYLFLSTSGEYSGLSRIVDWSELWISWSRNRDILPGTNVHAGRGWYMVVR
jgi:hypothetical protein